jgi:glycosidase
MQLSAISHRPDSEDAFLYDKDHLRIRLHTAKNDIAKVTVFYNDPYMFMPDKEGKYIFHYHIKKMHLISKGQVHDHWRVTLTAQYHRIQYLFEIQDTSGRKIFLTDRGFRTACKEGLNKTQNYYRLPYFHEIDMVKTPEWVKGTVWYQIFPERFSNGNKSNDRPNVKDWDPQTHPGREDFYGGDLQGVINHLDDLRELGVNGLYFCPIFKASSNHKYDTIDYKEVDPDFGDKGLFRQLVQEAHKRGMKVMLDAVFNHIGVNSPQWHDVIKNGSKSKYADWFHINYFPVEPYHDPTKGQGEPPYDTFAWEPHMPKWNTANVEVQNYLLDIASYWIKQFDIDAWRLDVAPEVDHNFWRLFRSKVDSLKKDFYIVGEIWHSAQSWLDGDQFSSTMNYPFTQQIEDHFLLGTKTSHQMVELLSDQLMLYRAQTNQVMLNTLDSHDTPRILTMANGDKKLVYQTIAFTFMQTGSPCIYYGTEMGMTGGPDPDCRKPMDWSHKGDEFWQKIAGLVKFRLRNARILGKGNTRMRVTEDGLIRIKRTESGQSILGYFNTTDKPVSCKMKAVLSQNFANDILEPHGFVIGYN